MNSKELQILCEENCLKTKETEKIVESILRLYIHIKLGAKT